MMAAGSPSGIVALGYRRSLIELRNNLGSLPGHLMFPVIAVVTISIVRHSDALAGRGASFGNYALIGILLINTLLSGVMGAASTVMQERMDGTLLRSSCLPHGTTAYAISKVLSLPARRHRIRSGAPAPVAGHGPHGTIPCEHRGPPRRRSCRAPLTAPAGRRRRRDAQESAPAQPCLHQRHAHRSSLGGVPSDRRIGRAHAGGCDDAADLLGECEPAQRPPARVLPLG